MTNAEIKAGQTKPIWTGSHLAALDDGREPAENVRARGRV